MAALHIIDQRTPPENLHNLASLIAPGEKVISLGPVAMPAGVSLPVRTISEPLGSSALAGLANSGLAGAGEVVHAWSLSAGAAGEFLARRGRRPLLVSLPHYLARQELRRLTLLTQPASATIAVHTNACRSMLLADGFAPAAVLVVPPAAAGVVQRDVVRGRVRQALGVADGQHLLAAPADMTHQGGHKFACWVTGILLQVRDDIRLLLPADGPARRGVEDFARESGFGKETFFERGRLSVEEALAAADVALFLPDGDCCVWSLAAAMASGLPIVAWDTGDQAECTDGGQAAALCRPGDVRSAAAATLRLLEDRTAAAELGARAAAIAASRFAPPDVRRLLDEAYSSARPAPPP